MNLRLEERRRQIQMLEKLADAQGISKIDIARRHGAAC